MKKGLKIQLQHLCPRSPSITPLKLLIFPPLIVSPHVISLPEISRAANVLEVENISLKICVRNKKIMEYHKKYQDNYHRIQDHPMKK